MPSKEELMGTMINIEVPVRPPEDLAGEGMWRIVAGDSCSECWDELPMDQKDWWRRCAMYAVRKWLGGVRPPL
jgi:hypothetical protein